MSRAPSEAPGSSRPPVSPQERGADHLGGAELKPGQPGPAGTQQACSGPQPPPEPCIHWRSVCSPRPPAGSCGASSPCVRCPCPAPVCAGQSPWQLGLVLCPPVPTRCSMHPMNLLVLEDGRGTAVLPGQVLRPQRGSGLGSCGVWCCPCRRASLCTRVSGCLSL